MLANLKTMSQMWRTFINSYDDLKTENSNKLNLTEAKTANILV